MIHPRRWDGDGRRGSGCGQAVARERAVLLLTQRVGARIWRWWSGPLLLAAWAFSFFVLSLSVGDCRCMPRPWHGHGGVHLFLFSFPAGGYGVAPLLPRICWAGSLLPLAPASFSWMFPLLCFFFIRARAMAVSRLASCSLAGAGRSRNVDCRRPRHLCCRSERPVAPPPTTAAGAFLLPSPPAGCPPRPCSFLHDGVKAIAKYGGHGL